MDKFHLNRETGEVRRCRASRRACPYGEDDHFENVSEARRSFEADNVGATIPDSTSSRTPSTDDATEVVRLARPSQLRKMVEDSGTSPELLDAIREKYAANDEIRNKVEAHPNFRFKSMSLQTALRLSQDSKTAKRHIVPMIHGDASDAFVKRFVGPKTDESVLDAIVSTPNANVTEETRSKASIERGARAIRRDPFEMIDHARRITTVEEGDEFARNLRPEWYETDFIVCSTLFDRSKITMKTVDMLSDQSERFARKVWRRRKGDQAFYDCASPSDWSVEGPQVIQLDDDAMKHHGVTIDDVMDFWSEDKGYQAIRTARIADGKLIID